jgi:hypothetical protein
VIAVPGGVKPKEAAHCFSRFAPPGAGERFHQPFTFGNDEKPPLPQPTDSQTLKVTSPLFEVESSLDFRRFLAAIWEGLSTPLAKAGPLSGISFPPSAFSNRA